MNIFKLDENPIIAAQLACDKHVIKMIKYIPMTPFKLAMKSNPESMSDDAVDSYRKYYRTKKDKFKMVWTKRDVPSWML